MVFLPVILMGAYHCTWCIYNTEKPCLLGLHVELRFELELHGPGWQSMRCLILLFLELAEGSFALTSGSEVLVLFYFLQLPACAK
jgi:hypothetical protein